MKRDCIYTHPLSYIENSSISKYTSFDSHTALKNCSVGSYSYIGRSSQLVNTKIGRYCSIGPECKINMGLHPLNLLGTSPLFYSFNNPFHLKVADIPFEEFKDVLIGSDVWVGSRVQILGGVTVGNGAVVAAGSVVVKDVEPFTVVGGVPARKIKDRFSEEVLQKVNKTEWWNLDHETLSDLSTSIENDFSISEPLFEYLDRLKK